MVDAFEDRIRDWYIEPIEILLEKRLGQTLRKIVRWLASRQEGGHYSFAIASMTCLLIDALSQFRYGKLTSDGAIFKQFVKDDLRSYKVTLPNSILHYEDKHTPNGKELKELADVLWNGFRCGFLRQAHAPLYCGVVPGNSAPRIEAKHATYGFRGGRSQPGLDCPVVVLQPEHLFDEVWRSWEHIYRISRTKILNTTRYGRSSGRSSRTASGSTS